MKYLIILSMLLTSLYSAQLSAKCNIKDQTLFFCKIQKSGKLLEVCDRGKTLSYSFGKKGKKPELSLIIPRKDASTYQWGGVGSSESYSVTIPNGDAKYNVFWRVDKSLKGFPETSGVIVEVKGKEVASLNCINKTVIHNLMDVDLKPEGEEEKIKTVKGPVFSVEVILSPKAKDKMAALNEKVIISSAFSATRAVPLKKAVDSEDPNIINLNEFEVEIKPSEIAHFKSIKFQKTKFDKIKKDKFGERRYELALSAYSARKSHKNNLLICSTLFDDLPSLLNHKHIRLWCSLIDESSMASKAEVLGKEKVKYDNALQSCFDQFGTMNNTVLASCKEEVSSEFKGTEREYLEAPKLEGLVNIEGSYVRQDEWSFSLDESSGFYLIHTINGEKDEVFIADGLELIEGNRYSIYVENLYGETDPKFALIFNPKTKHYDLEVKTYDKASNKWKSLLFSGN